MNTEKKENNIEIFVIVPDVPRSKTTNIKAKWWHIDKEMVRFKIHYFLFVGALGACLPFLSVFARNRIGLSATSYAAILTTQQFLFIFTKTLIGYLADYFKKLKTVICITTIITAIFLFLLLTIPKINKYQAVENYNPISFIPDKIQNESCTLFLESVASVRTKLKTNVACSKEFSTHQKIEQNCLMTVLPQSSKTSLDININSTTVVNQEMSISENEKISTLNVDSVCAMCCNITDNCYIISCPEHEKISGEETKEFSNFKTYQFWEFAVFLTIAQASLSGMFTLSDTALCETVVKTGSDFGKQRLYGAVGWGTMSPMGGLLNDYTDGFLSGWIITGVMLILSLWNLRKLDLVQPQFSQNILKDLGTVMSSKEFLTFQFGVFMNGVGTGILWSYQIWFLITIGASRFLCGLVQTVQTAGEVLFMFVSGRIIQKIGHFNAISLALTAYCTRFLWYSYLENPWLILPMEVASGITYGLFYPSVASYAKLSSKPGTEATTQSILFSTHEGLGAGLGCVLAGIGFDNIGGHQTFFYASIFCGCGMLVNLTFTLWNRKENKSIAITVIK